MELAYGGGAAIFACNLIRTDISRRCIQAAEPFFKSKPAPILLYSTIGVGVITMILPYLPLRKILDIEPIPPSIILALLNIVVLYIITTEIAKHYFYRAKPLPKRGKGR